MNWIEKSYSERKADVEKAIERLVDESPDRFWFSHDQDGENTQCMNIVLTSGDASLYEIRMVTVQLHAARQAAYALGQVPGEQLAITARLLDLASSQPVKEVFSVNLDSKTGIAVEFVVDAEGLTHDFIDALLGDFVDNGGQPLDSKEVSPSAIRARLIKARNGNLQGSYILS